MKISEIIAHLEEWASPSYAESYDNVGLLVGNSLWYCTGALIALDSTEEVVQEAIDLGYNLIIAHHPIIFGGLKKLTGKNYVERTVIKAIKNDIAIYAIHTNLDNIQKGVNSRIASKLGLENLKILSPKSNNMTKLSVYVPNANTEKVSKALFEAGAGIVGNYSEASFMSKGVGTFRGNELSNPTIGKANEKEEVNETKLEVLVPNFRINKVLEAMEKSHPYEEIAYDLIELKNKNKYVGSGMIGELKADTNILEYLNFVKKVFGLSILKYTQLNQDTIRKVAICGGSGSFLIHEAKSKGADIYITSDIKYHEFFDGEGKMSIVDIGHFESEQFTQEIILELFEKKIVSLQAQISKVRTNPVRYL